MGNKGGEKSSRKRYEKKSPFSLWAKRLDVRRIFIVGKLYEYFPSFPVHKVIFLILFSLLFSLILFFEFDQTIVLKAGEVAKKNIISPYKFTFVDEVATFEKKRDAKEKILSVYDHKREVFEEIELAMTDAFSFMRKELKALELYDFEEKSKLLQESLRFKNEAERRLGVNLTESQFLWLSEKKWSFYWKRVILGVLQKWYESKILDSKTEEGSSQSQKKIIIREWNKEDSFEELLASYNELIGLNQRNTLRKKVKLIKESVDSSDQVFLEKIAFALLRPSIVLNTIETEKRKSKSEKEVPDVKVTVEKNEVIVVAGSQVTIQQQGIMEKAQLIERERRTGGVHYASMGLFILLVYVFLSYIRRAASYKIRVRLIDMQVMGFVALLGLVFVKLFLFLLQSTILGNWGSVVPLEILSLALPVSMSTILIGLFIINGEFVWIFTCFMSIAMGVLFQGNWGLMALTMLGGVAGARGVYNCKKRVDIYRAGVRTGLIQALVALFVIVIYHANQKVGLGYDLAWGVPLAFLGGILSSFLAMMFIPLIESFFNYTTNIKLLELSDFNHPLLRELAIKAPGTYHHCIAVGSMAEEAAQSIGANSLLARVMAYYHDIGKADHAQYFAENISGKDNPHQSISPYLSKTIIIAHVKDGAEKGLKFKLGQPIIDGILQHHGTSVISYFYAKAKELETDEKKVDEMDFRYPGPKPQFKEAALVMLADSIEASARALSDPTPARLSNLVRNVIQDKFLDGQLDECNLTLKDLSIIEQTFYKVLISLYHQRKEYPHLDFGHKRPGPLSKKESEERR